MGNTIFQEPIIIDPWNFIILFIVYRSCDWPIFVRKKWKLLKISGCNGVKCKKTEKLKNRKTHNLTTKNPFNKKLGQSQGNNNRNVSWKFQVKRTIWSKVITFPVLKMTNLRKPRVKIKFNTFSVFFSKMISLTVL